MKISKVNIVLVSLALGIIIGVTVGFYFGKRSSLSEQKEYFLMHEGLERQARVYYKFLQVQDSGRVEDTTKLRKEALATFDIYISEADEFRAKGFKWAPMDRELYESVSAYLKNNPLPDKKQTAEASN